MGADEIHRCETLEQTGVARISRREIQVCIGVDEISRCEILERTGVAGISRCEIQVWIGATTLLSCVIQLESGANQLKNVAFENNLARLGSKDVTFELKYVRLTYKEI